MKMNIQTFKAMLGIDEDQLLRFLHVRARKLNGTEISPSDFEEFKNFRLVDKKLDADGNENIFVTDLGSSIYTYLSTLVNKGGIFIKNGKWVITE